MARHPERRTSEQPKPPTTQTSPRWQEVTRFASAKLRVINTVAFVFADTHAGYKREDLVASVSSTMGEKPPRVNMAMDVINQLGSLSQRPDTKEPPEYIVGPDDTWGEVIVRRDLNRADGKLIYDLSWVKGPPEALTKPKIEQAQPVQPEAPKPATYEFRTAAQREAEKQPGQVTPSSQPRWRQERDRKRSQREEETQREKVRAERTAIEDVVIDTGRELAEMDLEKDFIRVELGGDNIAKILYKRLYRTNPDGTQQYDEVDRKTGQFAEDDTFYRGSILRPDVHRYMERLAQALEGKEVVEYAPASLSPELVQRTYDRAITAGVIQIKDGADFQYLAFQGTFDGYFGKMDLERNMVEKTQFSKERPIHPQFAEFLRQRKAEIDNPQVPNQAEAGKSGDGGDSSRFFYSLQPEGLVPIPRIGFRENEDK